MLAGSASRTHQCGMSDPIASASELTEKRVRLGKVGGQPVLPVADVDGVLIENASLPVILRRRH